MPSDPPGSLYALDLESRRIEAQIEAVAAYLGSDDPDQEALACQQLEALLAAGEHTRAALEQRCDASLWVADRLTGRAAQLREHAERLLRLADEDAARADMLVQRVVAALQSREPESTTFRLPEHKLRSRASTTTDLSDVDVDKLPPELVRLVPPVPETRQPNAMAIKAALKAGQTVPGATLVTRRHWTID